MAIQEEIRCIRNGLPRFKSRLVARGYTQREGFDFNEIFSLVVKHTSIRILFSMVDI